MPVALSVSARLTAAQAKIRASMGDRCGGHDRGWQQQTALVKDIG